MPWRGRFHLTLLSLVPGPSLQARLSMWTVRMGQSCQNSLVSLGERGVCKVRSNGRKCCSVMQFPCDSYSEILKTARNESFNFQLNRCPSPKGINRCDIPSELVAQVASQPRWDSLGSHGQEEHRHLTWAFCNPFMRDNGLQTSVPAGVRPPPLTQLLLGACSTPSTPELTESPAPAPLSPAAGQLGILHIPSPHLSCPATEGTSLSSQCLPHSRDVPDGVPTVPSVSCRALHGHRDARSRAGAPAPRDPSEVALAWGRGALCILSLQQQGRGQRKNGKKEEEKRNCRHVPHRQDPLDLPLSSALRSCSAGTRPQSRIPAKLMYKNPISLLKAGHLATLMKSALVSGSALSTLFYFCPRARFSYYKQDFQS